MKDNILYEEFKLDSNFISLSKLSSEDRGIVDKRQKLTRRNTFTSHND